jgi:murein DD-endopeptidase MepM/ murein hydrolase activator NlpD
LARRARERFKVPHVSPRRKRRSAEVRNSLRLFGLLAVLAGVNVYVFFFNRGTAPREVLKPSSTFKAADGANGKAATLKEAAADAKNQLKAQVAGAGSAADSLEVPVATGRQVAAVKAKPPVPLAPAASKAAAGRPTSVAAGGSPPKGSPGGSPGQDDGTPAPQVQSNSAPVTPSGSPENSQRPSQENPSQESPNQEKTFGDSDTLGQVLAREGFDDDAPQVVAALSRLLDPKLIRGGQHYSVRLNEQGEPEAFEYHPNPVTRYVATRGPSGAWVGTRVEQPLMTQIESASGTIDATLYESIQRAGESAALVGLLVDLLAWDVNFYTDTHPGDHWKVIVEKQYLGGKFYRYGHVLAAEYGGRVGNFRAFHWKSGRANASGEGRYFDEKGQAISKTLLKTPLRFVRISSRFDRHRLHPVLHREKAHLGIDYAAPTGTPVWASSGGKVVECAMKRGSGNTVVLSHGNGMSTRYYHLSRFARGLRVGKTVRQKEVIGFVGTTGLSTGPHLHFSVTKNGAFVDPNKVQLNRDAPVDNRSAFLAAIKPRLTTLQALDPRTIARN